MNRTPIVLAAALVAISQEAKAAEAYVSLNLGAAIETDGDDSSAIPTLGVTAGLKNIAREGPISLRAEIEAQLAIQDEAAPIIVGANTDEEATTVAVFANLWMDYQPWRQTPFTVSIGGGIGLAVTDCNLCIGSDFTGQVGDKTDLNFAFNLGIAAAYQISPGWELGGTVRYFDYGSVSDADAEGFFVDTPVLIFQSSVPRRGVQAMATLRYTFGSIDF